MRVLSQNSQFSNITSSSNDKGVIQISRHPPMISSRIPMFAGIFCRLEDITTVI